MRGEDSAIHDATGRLTFLASLFRSPYGAREHGFVRQFQMLEAWAGKQADDE